MKHFDIRTSAEGNYEVVVLEPAILGTFSDRENALIFMAALECVAPKAEAVAPDPPKKSDPPAKLAPPAPEPAPAPVKVAEPAPAPRPTAKPARQKKPMLSAIPDTETTNEDWSAALNRIAAGEKVMAVAEAMGLSFGKLRSRWATAIQRGTHQKPGADDPVSGGVTGVLERGTGFAWTSEKDAAIVAARPDFLGELANLYELSEATIRDRKVALEERLAKMMRED